MGKRDKGDSGRGWSLVFDERTDKSQDRDTDEQPQADYDPATIIDRDMSAEIAAALNARNLPPEPVDPRLENVVVTTEASLLEDHGPEVTMLAPAPVFDETPMPDFEDTIRPPPVTTDPGEDELVFPDDEDDDPLLANVEATRKAPIPYDLFHEGSLPEIVRAKPTITRRKISAIEPKPPTPPARSGSETMLDLAAQLGLAPQAKPALADEGPTVDEPLQRATMELEATPNDEIDLLPFLDDDNPLSPAEKKKKAGVVPIVRQKVRPSEGASADDIHRWTAGADSVARTIPVILAIFVAMGTVIAIFMLFSGGGRKQEHVEMRFLSLRGQKQRAVRPSTTPTRITIDTIPDGVFVLYGQDILGKTPITADILFSLDERVAVELTGPYYEKWVGEVDRDPAGEYKVFVELQKK